LPTAAIWRPNSTHKPLLLFQEILAELGQPATAGG
jgi:hypothetical protein